MKARRDRIPDPVDRHVGARIRERRLALCVTQAELGRWLDLSDQQIRRIERGSSSLAPRQILALASRLQVDSGYFLEGAPPATLGEDVPGPEVIEIVESFRAIRNDGMRRDLILLVQAAARHSLAKGLKEKRT